MRDGRVRGLRGAFVRVVAVAGNRFSSEQLPESATEFGAAPPGSIARVRGSLVHALEEERSRWFYWLPVVFGAGIGFYFLLPREPPLLGVLSLCCAAFAFRMMATKGSGVLLCSVLVAVSAGLSVAKLRSERLAAPVLEKRYRAIEVRGHVELVEPRPGKGERITLRLERLGDLPRRAMPARARIRTMAATPGLLPGDLIEIKARLAPPAEPVLPGGFNFARTAWFQQIGAVGFSLQPPRIVSRADNGHPAFLFRSSIERLRRAISVRVREVLPGETGAIAVALITGERGGITEDTNQAFRNSGLFHILSISGLHMVVMAGAVFYAVRLVLALFPPIALRYPIKKWAAAIALIAASLYLLISGSAFATQRSYLMIAIMFFAVLIDRPGIAMRNVALAALLILALYPESLLDAGFQMSFAAVIGLVAAYEWIRDWRQAHTLEHPLFLLRPLLFFGGILLTTLVAGVAVAPFAAYHFHTSQQFALIANLIAIPICNLIVMPAALLTFVLLPVGLEALPLAVMGEGIEAIVRCANWASSLPGAVIRVSQIPFLSFLLIAGGGLWLALWHRRWRLFGVALAAIGAGSVPLLSRPADILIGRGGELIAVRTEEGRLAALAARASDFELSRWLEQDGDGRRPKEVRTGSRFRCDEVGCQVKTRAGLLAVSKHPASLEDDCAASVILIAAYPVPGGCRGPREIFDYWRLEAGGTHALALSSDGAIAIDTVTTGEGLRPWEQKRKRQFSPRTPHVAGQDRTARSPRAPASGRTKPNMPEADLRPEVEDDVEMPEDGDQ